MKFLLVPGVLLALSGIVSSQQLLQFGSGQLPSCARSCTLLNQAQNACPNNSNQPVICFCQSSYLTALKSSPDGTCDAECTSETDRQQIYSWYNGFCANGGAAASASLAAATAGGAAATTLSTAVSSATATPASGTSGNTATGTTVNGEAQSTTSNDSSHPSWWSQHYRWIVMVIVLAVAFVIIIIVGVWAKKRYIQKRDQTLLNGSPAGWAPPPTNRHAAGGLAQEKDSGRASGKLNGTKSNGGMVSKLKSLEQKLGGR